VDCGLIVEKGRGLNEKWLEYLIFKLFLIENGHGPGPWAVAVHGGPQTGPQWWLTGGRSERRPGARNLAAVEEKGGGDGGDPHRLQEGRKQLGINGQETVEESLSAGGAWSRREEKRGGERCSGGRRWPPFI
jgi:hypothetical protein